MGQQAILNQAAFDIGQMADRLTQGYFMRIFFYDLTREPLQCLIRSHFVFYL